uniref:Uncharacterized protein n=1 Tax=Cacopsylla melanoneura TaxID=428564 RepID=A0A8D8TC06_9HEMI
MSSELLYEPDGEGTDHPSVLLTLKTLLSSACCGYPHSVSYSKLHQILRPCETDSEPCNRSTWYFKVRRAKFYLFLRGQKKVENRCTIVTPRGCNTRKRF